MNKTRSDRRIKLEYMKIPGITPQMIKLTLAVLFVSCFGSMAQDPFEGITDKKILPMLQHLPYKFGGMNVPPSDGRLLFDLVKENGYRRGLEVGTSNGYSALWIGLAFRETGGKMITIEIDAKSAAEARENFRKAGLDTIIDSRINDAFAEIPGIEGEFDFIFLDSWKPDYIRLVDLLYDRLKPGGIIAAHNVTNQGNQMKDFLDRIRKDPGLTTRIEKSSSSGMSVSRKKE